MESLPRPSESPKNQIVPRHSAEHQITAFDTLVTNLTKHSPQTTDLELLSRLETSKANAISAIKQDGISDVEKQNAIQQITDIHSRALLVLDPNNREEQVNRVFDQLATEVTETISAAQYHLVEGYDTSISTLEKEFLIASRFRTALQMLADAKSKLHQFSVGDIDATPEYSTLYRQIDTAREELAQSYSTIRESILPAIPKEIFETEDTILQEFSAFADKAKHAFITMLEKERIVGVTGYTYNFEKVLATYRQLLDGLGTAYQKIIESPLCTPSSELAYQSYSTYSQTITLLRDLYTMARSGDSVNFSQYLTVTGDYDALDA